MASGLIFEGCYSDSWEIHSNGYCPNSFPLAAIGPLGTEAFDTWLVHWHARGPGAAVSLSFGSLNLDYFVGFDGAGPVTACYDLPPGAPVPSSQATCP